jgi:hypothetical protein
MVLFMIRIIRYHNELYTLYDEMDVVNVVKIGRMIWLEHIFGMQLLEPCGKITVFKPVGTRRVGKPKFRRLKSVEEDPKNMGARNWGSESQDREQWRTIFEKTRIHQGL